MSAVVATKGYTATTVSDVITRAGVSRATFYELFESKESAFIAAHEAFSLEVFQRVNDAFQGLDRWPDRVRAGLRALLECLAEKPDAARLTLVEVIGAGERAHSRLRTASRAFVPFFDEGREYAPEGDELPEHVSLVVVGGVVRMIFEEIMAENTTDLPRLLPDLVFITLVPYLGREAAIEEMRRTESERPDSAV